MGFPAVGVLARHGHGLHFVAIPQDIPAHKGDHAARGIAGTDLGNDRCAAPDPVPANGPQDSDAPGVLTDNQRSDILAAVDRANLAWSNATQTLDGAALNGNVAVVTLPFATVSTT